MAKGTVTFAAFVNAHNNTAVTMFYIVDRVVPLSFTFFSDKMKEQKQNIYLI